MAALYQVGDDVFDCFDKVLLLDEGREIFFGPTETAATYFDGMGFIRDSTLTTSEYLINVAEARYRIASNGSKASSMHSSQDLVVAFKASTEYATLLRELSAEKLRTSDTNHKEKSRYRLSFLRQIAECLQFPELFAAHSNRTVLERQGKPFLPDWALS
jgi:ATP-binding cassette subfamily G (WHITE) protein 2 (SNQ2)